MGRERKEGKGREGTREGICAVVNFP